jgi:tetratricopeptide (TPR) repeat protein
MLAKTYRRKGDYPRSIGLYRQAVAAAPDDPEIRYNLAVTLQEAGRTAEAFDAITEAIRRDPSRPEAHNTLGIALAQQGKLGEALRGIRSRRQSSIPETPGLRTTEATSFDRWDVAEAEDAYRQAVAIAPLRRSVERTARSGSRGRPAEAGSPTSSARSSSRPSITKRASIWGSHETRDCRPRRLAAYQDFIREAGRDPGFSAQRAVARQLIARLSGAARAPSEPEGR